MTQAVNMQAAQDPTHPDHHFSLGQALALALLGLAAYQQASGPGGPGVFLNPTITAPFLQGVLNIFHPPAQVS